MSDTLPRRTEKSVSLYAIEFHTLEAPLFSEGGAVKNDRASIRAVCTGF